jgi:hypothetical protein
MSKSAPIHRLHFHTILYAQTIVNTLRGVIDQQKNRNFEPWIISFVINQPVE